MNTATPANNRASRPGGLRAASGRPVQPRPPAGPVHRLAHARAALAGAWASAREVSYAPAIERRGVSADALRRWLPFAIPLAFTAAALAVALVITRSPHGRATIAPSRIWLLGGVLLLAGVPLGAALKRASSDAAWVALLSLGAAVEITLSVAVLAGIPAALLALLALLATGCALIYGRVRRVEPDTAVITTLAGQHSRTLLPATHVLLPGETTLTTLPTGLRNHATLPQRVTTAGGTLFQASARMRYRLIPEQAHRAIHADAHWERTLHRLLAETVAEELARGASGRNVEALRRDVERLIRGYGLTRGIRVEWVRLEEVTLGPAVAEALTLPAAPTQMPSSLARQQMLATAPKPPNAVIAPQSPTPAPAVPGEDAPATPHWWEHPRQALRDLAQAVTARIPSAHPAETTNQTGADTADTPVAPTPTADPPPSPAVLTAAYEAIREGRVNDPATVRHVADAFARLAQNEQLASALEFDPERAAHLLMQRAQMLGDPSRDTQHEPGDQRVPQSPPRDDNVIRGG
jgi:SPFH domain/Band 7 family protein